MAAHNAETYSKKAPEAKKARQEQDKNQTAYARSQETPEAKKG